MGERAWTMQEIEQLKATQADAPKGRRVPWSKLGYHEHEDFGLVAVDLWPHGLDDGSPVQGFLSHPERSGADLGALVTGADGSELDSAFWEALAVNTDQATAWAFAHGFEWADGEPLERTPEGIDKGRMTFLLLPHDQPR